MCKIHFRRKHLCALQVFVCAFVSRPVCARTAIFGALQTWCVFPAPERLRKCILIPRDFMCFRSQALCTQWILYYLRVHLESVDNVTVQNAPNVQLQEFVRSMRDISLLKSYSIPGDCLSAPRIIRISL